VAVGNHRERGRHSVIGTQGAMVLDGHTAHGSVAWHEV